MSDDSDVAYEFGEFVLIPDEGVLLRSNEPVPIAPSELDILKYFVRNNRKVIRPDDVRDSVNDPARTRHPRNFANHVSQLRKVLGDDAAAPRYIRSVHGTNGYRFLPMVIVHDRLAISYEPETGNDKNKIQITANLFVPMFLGESFYSDRRLVPVANRWMELKHYVTTSATLYVSATGFGVWHISSAETFANLSDFAYWRRDLYEEISRGKHAINRDTKQLLKTHGPSQALNGDRGLPGYVFSLNVVEKVPFRSLDNIRNFLKILACPSVLLYERHERTRSRSVEKLLMQGGVPIKEITDFGLGDIGFGSWDSISYLTPEFASIEKSIIEFEIAVQLLWWKSRFVADVFLSGEPSKIESVRKLIPAIRRQLATLKSIGPNERPAERTMIEAVLSTSRIDQVVSEALELAEQNTA